MDKGKLVVEINNRDPVELADLTRSLLALASEYADFADEALDGKYRSETKLYVKEIRTGSIITELVPYAAGLLPILSDVNTVVAFAQRLKGAIDRLLSPKRDEKSLIDRPTLENISALIEPVAKDSASQINITTVVHNHAPVNISLNSTEANAVQRQILRQLESMKEPTKLHHEKVVMYWYQARDDLASTTGDKAKIDSISPKPVKAIFVSEATKAKMLRAEENPFKYAFVVDVDVETVEGKPVLYKILDFHERIERD